MLFGDEKDYNIEDGADIQISEDGTVTWEDVLNSDNEDIDLPVNVNTGGNSDNIVASGDDSLDLISDLDDDISDEELSRILGDAPADDDDVVTEDALNLGQPKKSLESYNADDLLATDDEESALVGEVQEKQLASIIMDDEDEAPQPKRREYNLPQNDIPTDGVHAAPVKPKNQNAKVLIVFVTLLLVVGLYFFITNAIGGSQDEVVEAPREQQEAMNELTPEELEARNKADIPVVNEEQVAAIKPEEVEKKKTIEVQQTGRVNPFSPLQKYENVKPVAVPETEVLFSKTAISLPPAKYGTQDERIDKLITIAVSGIMYDPQKPSAIITYDDNDYFVQKGDKLDDYKVLDIAKNYVVIALGNNTYKANVGEEFKINDKFYGSAQYFPGGRQYHAVGVNEQPAERVQNQRYVSERDIDIQQRQ